MVSCIVMPFSISKFCNGEKHYVNLFTGGRGVVTDVLPKLSPSNNVENVDLTKKERHTRASFG